MTKHIVCIASEFKGNEFLEEAHASGWDVTLVTRKKLLESDWAWDAIADTRAVDDDASPLDYVRAATNILGSRDVDNIVGLDEFDVITAAMAREHVQIDGLSSSFLRRFRDKLTMRNLAEKRGIPCPDFIGAFNAESISNFLDNVPAPWIVKPRFEVSAFGIRKCETAEDVWSVLNDLDQRNNWRDHPSQFVIERFVEGKVFHVDSVVNDGAIIAAGVSRYGTTPFAVSHYGGVFSSSIVPYQSEERQTLELLNSQLLSAFDFKKGVTHAEFLRSDATGEFFLLEVACRVGGAYIANVLEHAAGFNLWREWAKLETSTVESPYTPPKLREDLAGITLALANVDQPDTSHYNDAEIVYRVNKPNHVGMIFRSESEDRINELIMQYTERIGVDFLATAPVKERYDD